jgi:hypothetical protein
MQINCKNTVEVSLSHPNIEYLFQQWAKYDDQPPTKTMMLNCEQNKAVLTDT